MSPLVRSKLHAARLALASALSEINADMSAIALELPYPKEDGWLETWSAFVKEVAELVDEQLWELVTLASLLASVTVASALAVG